MTMKALFMCPGQGSQRPGMAADLLQRWPSLAGPVFALADEVLGWSVTDLCVRGSAEDLRATDVTQPAVLVTSLATLAVLRAGGLEPVAVAGHSLGEFAALAAAGVLSAESALVLVGRRGELMAAVGARVPGAMSAVIGLPAERVEALCVAEAGAEVANYNDPAQTVVSGYADAVARVGAAAVEAGAERVVPLAVSAPFHCSLMAAVADEFDAELARHEFADPAVPVLSAVDADWVRTGAGARALLRRQLTGPVRWVQTLRRAAQAGPDTLIEVGPGRVLTGFAKRTTPDLPAYGSGGGRAIETLLARGTATAAA
jgi:[acyl-carrier-protein] S-malonyltransferase